MKEKIEQKFFSEVKNYVYIEALCWMYKMFHNSFIYDGADKMSEFRNQEEPEIIFEPNKVYSKVAFEMYSHISQESTKRLYNFYKLLGEETFKKEYSKYVNHILDYIIDKDKIGENIYEVIKNSGRGLLIKFKKGAMLYEE